MQNIEKRKGKFFIGQQELQSGDQIEFQHTDMHPTPTKARVRIDSSGIYAEARQFTASLNFVDYDCTTVARLVK